MRPVLDSSTPVAGEAFASFVMRYSAANGIDTLRQFFDAMGLGSERPFDGVYVMRDEVDHLADALSIEPGFIERSIFAGNDECSRLRLLHHTEVQTWWIERNIRRVAPEGLRRAPYARAAWQLGLLSFCPETFQYLIDECPRCGIRLGWYHTIGVDICEKCIFDLKRAHSGFVEQKDQADLSMVANLVHHDIGMVQASLDQLPFAITAAGALELVRELQTVVDPRICFRVKGWKMPGDVSAAATAEAWRLMCGWPDGIIELFGERLANGTSSRLDGNGGRSMRLIRMQPVSYSAEVATLLKDLRARLTPPSAAVRDVWGGALFREED